MSLIQKIKLLFVARKPATQLITQVKEIKRGWKKPSFWAAFLGTILSTLGALGGIVPPEISVIINTILTAFYNILRGLQKSEETGIRPILRSTEFYQGALGEFSNALVALQGGYVDPHILRVCEATIAFLMAISQNIGAQQPYSDQPKSA